LKSFANSNRSLSAGKRRIGSLSNNESGLLRAAVPNVRARQAAHQGGGALITTAARGHARNIHIRSPCWITNPAPRVLDVFCRGRGQGRRVALISACSEMFPVMIAVSQCWGCDASDGCESAHED